MRLIPTLVALMSIAVCCATAEQSSFITRNGTHLMLEGQVFRFAGGNAYWLGLDENVDGIGYPTHFRVNDTLSTAKLMGARVVRSHTLGISTGNPLSFEPSLNVWNDDALEHIDYAVHRAGQLGLRLVVPLTDNWHYYHGGKHNFADWFNLPEAAFYTDDRCIDAFETYIAKLLNHTNRYNGKRYLDDPAVLAWETGNEIKPPLNWTARISKFIKSIDPNHLVLSGQPRVAPAELPLPDVDLYSDHYYPMDPALMATHAALVHSAGKVFIVGEFGWPQGNLTLFLDTAQAAEGLSGDIYWSLFGHLDTFGYEEHGDGFTMHYPGDTSLMRLANEKLTAHAWDMAGLAPVPPLVVDAALLHPVGTATGNVTWRGAAGACGYRLHQRVHGQATRVYNISSDNDLPFSGLHPEPTSSCELQVWPVACSGELGPASNVVSCH